VAVYDASAAQNLAFNSQTDKMSVREHFSSSIRLNNYNHVKFASFLEQFTGDQLNQIKVCANGFIDLRPLHLACVENNHEALKQLIKVKNIDVDIQTVKGATPFLCAISASSVECVKVLANNQKVNIFTSVAIIERSGPEKDKQKINDIIQKKRRDRIKLGKVSILHQLIAYIENNDDFNFSRLLANMDGDQINEGDHRSIRPIHVACAANNHTALEKILKVENIDVNIQDRLSTTAFFCAFGNGSLKSMEILLKDPRIDIFTLKNPPIHTSKYIKSAQDIEKIISLVEEEKFSRIQLGKASLLQQLLQSARSDDKLVMIQVLKQMTRNQVNECDPIFKFTPLHIACSVNNSKAVSQLLKFINIDVNPRSGGRNTPFMQAVGFCNIECIETLMVDTRLELDSPETVESWIGKLKFDGGVCTESEQDKTLKVIRFFTEKRENLIKMKKKREQKKKNCDIGTTTSQSKGDKNVDVDELLQFIEGPSKSTIKIKKKKKKQTKIFNLQAQPMSESTKAQPTHFDDDNNLPLKDTIEQRKQTQEYNEKNMQIVKKIPDDVISNIPPNIINEKVESLSITEEYKWIKRGKLSFISQNVIGSGGQGTVVFSGNFDGRLVAIKRLLKTRWKEADKEKALLLKADDHPNIIRYISLEDDDSFVYLALELCLGNLKDLIEGNLNMEIEALTIIGQALAGLDHLHSLQQPIIHRDVKPSNILILVPNTKDPPRAVISDLGCSKQIEAYQTSFSISGIHGTTGWIAPEVLNDMEEPSEHFRSSYRMDIFSMGIVMYYTLTSGHHPFGNKPHRRDVNIMDNKFNLKNLDDQKDCLSLNLIKKMIAHDPYERPSASDALNHPTFWPTSKTKDFLCKVSDILEMNDKDQLNAIEEGIDEVLPTAGHNWMDDLGEDIVRSISQYRTYNGTKVKDLLRAIRNMSHHFHHLDPVVKLAIGSLEDGLVNYWVSRFPKLVLHTHNAMITWKSCDELATFYNL